MIKMPIENEQGVHSKERLQYSNVKKSTAEKYREHCGITYDQCDSDKVEDVSKRGKVMILKS